jgi:hypothetical protein
MAKSSTSFERGNRSGVATRFAPGTSGNLGGRPVRKPYAEAYRKYADLPITELKVSERDTAAEAGVKSILRSAIGITIVKGGAIRIERASVHAIREAADRTEGRVPLPLIGRSDEPVTFTILSNIPRPDRSKKTPPKKVPENVQ